MVASQDHRTDSCLSLLRVSLFLILLSEVGCYGWITTGRIDLDGNECIGQYVVRCEGGGVSAPV